MANDQFHKLLRFAKRTGDRLIVTDESGGEPLVILPFEQYEALVNGFLGPDDGEHELDHVGHDHPHPHHSHQAEEQAEPEFEPEDEEIGEIEIDQAFLAPPTPPLEVTRPTETRAENRPEPRPEFLTEPQTSPIPPVSRPPVAPKQGTEEQFYLEPL